MIVRQFDTGVPGLDAILHGGYLGGGPTLLMGQPGLRQNVVSASVPGRRRGPGRAGGLRHLFGIAGTPGRLYDRAGPPGRTVDR